jgi:hypothetical protein
MRIKHLILSSLLAASLLVPGTSEAARGKHVVRRVTRAQSAHPVGHPDHHPIGHPLAHTTTGKQKRMAVNNYEKMRKEHYTQPTHENAILNTKKAVVTEHYDNKVAAARKELKDWDAAGLKKQDKYVQYNVYARPEGTFHQKASDPQTYTDPSGVAYHRTGYKGKALKYQAYKGKQIRKRDTKVMKYNNKITENQKKIDKFTGTTQFKTMEAYKQQGQANPPPPPPGQQ